MREVLITEDELSDFEESIDEAEDAKALWQNAKSFIEDLKNRLTKYQLL